MKKKLVLAITVILCLLVGCKRAEKEKIELPVQNPANTQEPEKESNLNSLKEQEEEDPIVLAVDAGHGGAYAGAAYDGKVEKDLNLKVAGYIKDFLENNYTGISVFLTRESDTALADGLADDLKVRAKKAKDAGADAFVSLHFNATESHDNSGAMIFVSNQEQVRETCDALAESILKNLCDLGLSNEGVRTRDSSDLKDENGKPLDYYAVHRNAAEYGIPAIIVEHCYLDNASDRKFIEDEEALKKLAEADAKGIAEYYQLKEK